MLQRSSSVISEALRTPYDAEAYNADDVLRDTDEMERDDLFDVFGGAMPTATFARLAQSVRDRYMLFNIMQWKCLLEQGCFQPEF